MSGYIGNTPALNATQVRQTFTATAGQTSFATAGYQVGYLDTFLNGIKLNVADVTATNGSDVVVAACAAGDILDVILYGTFDIANMGGAAFNGDVDVTGTVSAVGNLDILQLTGTSGNAFARFTDSDASSDFSIGADDSSGAGAGAFIFYDRNNSAYRLVIDSSGNVLVGKTSAGLSTAGVQLDATGSGGFCRAETCLTLSRLSTDGSILDFRKDSTTVGSIGTSGGDAYFGTGDTGLIAYDNGNAILPFNTATGAYADNSLDFGVATQRFKNAYLSGGVYLGGTGAANKLSDYEEGTFTPTPALTTPGNSSFGYSAQVAHYVKVGDIVHFQLNIRVNAFTKGTGSGTVLVAGLPFTAHNTSGYASAGLVIRLYGWTFSNIPTASVVDNATYCSLQTMSSNAAAANLADPDSSAMIWLSGTYRAA